MARLAGKVTIAGSTLTLDRAVRTAVVQGIPLQEVPTCRGGEVSAALGADDASLIAASTGC